MSDPSGPAPGVGATWSSRLATELSRATIAQYAGASGDVNLVHVDESFAAAAGFPSVIAHGMLTIGLTGSFLTAVFGHDNVRKFGGRFRAPVVVADSLDCTIEVRAVRRASTGTELAIDLQTTKTDGTLVFMGEAVVVVPPSRLDDTTLRTAGR